MIEILFAKMIAIMRRIKKKERKRKKKKRKTCPSWVSELSPVFCVTWASTWAPASARTAVTNQF